MKIKLRFEGVNFGLLAKDCPLQAVDFFFSALTRYREACLGVPLVSPSAEESREEFRYRRACAESLFADYAQSMSEIKRFWIPKLNSKIPTELHDDFCRRIEPFLTLPSKQEFHSAPIFERQGISPRNIRSPVTSELMKVTRGWRDPVGAKPVGGETNKV